MNPLHLWIDDTRPTPDDTWLPARSSAEAITIIEYYLLRNGNPSQMVISFDHDLGGEDTAMKVVDYIDNLWRATTLPMFTWHVHSQNPIGAERIKLALHRLEETLAQGLEDVQF